MDQPSPSQERINAQIGAERLLLAALAQGSLSASAGESVRRHLTITQFADLEHEIVFRALAKLPAGEPARIRETLAGAVTRLGFPDINLDSLFTSAAPAEADLPALFARLQTGGHAALAPPPDTAPRRPILAALDVVAIPLLISWLIWHEHSRAIPYLAVILVTWVAASLWLHHDTPRTLGLRADNLRAATRPAILVFGWSAVLLVAIGLVLRRIVPHSFLPLDPVFEWPRVALYSVSAFLQQFVLNSLLTNRLLSLTSRRWTAVLCSSVIFCALHWPNPVLVPLTLAAGVATAWLFSRERNLIPLVVGHAALGLLIWWTFPFGWHHAMRVGPAYREYHGYKLRVPQIR